MLKFDANHDSFNKPIKKEIGKKIKNMVVAGLLVFSIAILSGCCDIEEVHAHKYVSENYGVCFYIPSDSSYLYGKRGKMRKTDDYIYIDEQERYLYENFWLDDIIKISDNKEYINKKLSELEELTSFIEYEYTYTTTLWAGKSAVTTTNYGWTIDSTHDSLTGNVRSTIPAFCGYKIVKDDNGSFNVEKSKPYDSFDKLVEDGYDFVPYNLVEYYHFDLEKQNDNDSNLSLGK